MGKELYRIVDFYSEETIYVYLAKEQVSALEKFIDWSGNDGNFTIEKVDIVATTW